MNERDLTIGGIAAALAIVGTVANSKPDHATSYSGKHQVGTATSSREDA